MLSKSKASVTQAKSNGRHVAKLPRAVPRSNGLAGKHAEVEAKRAPKADSPAPAPATFRGVLEEFNFSPKGGIEGFLLHADGQTVQINVSVDVGFAVVRGIGQSVQATVKPVSAGPKHGKPHHPVFDLVTLTGNDGKELIHCADPSADSSTVEGTVKRVNFARHGAANGVVLDSGDFIHLKPEGMKKVELKVGDHVTAEGIAALMPLGQRVIEATIVNGVSLSSKKSTRAKKEPNK
jgi:hypothetical protein